MPPKAIPDRWIPYQPCGKVVEGTRFICFKVPLKRSVQNNNRDIQKIWDIPTVLEDIPKLGAVIDLTNTARYYNPMDFLKANVLHRKILMPGRIIPPESSVKEHMIAMNFKVTRVDVVQKQKSIISGYIPLTGYVRKFMNAVDEFLAKDSESLIGVHCTHGLNRTGYMVCRFMRDRLCIPAQEAITRFETARGYKMERDIYINDILGTQNKSNNKGKKQEVIPVKSRRDDVTYRSPLCDERDETVDYSKRFGTSGSNDRYWYNRHYQHSNRSGNNNSALYSCYTKRYNNEPSSSGSARSDRRSNGSPLSWRNRRESSGSSQRYRTDDNSGLGCDERSKTGDNRNRRDDRSGTKDY